MSKSLGWSASILNSFDKEIWTEKYFSRLNYKEKLVWLHLISLNGTSGVFTLNKLMIKDYINSLDIVEKRDDGLFYDKNGYFPHSEIGLILEKFQKDKKISYLKDGSWLFLSYFTDHRYKNTLGFTLDIKNLRILIKDHYHIKQTIKNNPAFFNNLTEKLTEVLNRFFNRTCYYNTNYEKIKKQNTRMLKEYVLLYESISLEIPEKVVAFIDRLKED